MLKKWTLKKFPPRFLILVLEPTSFITDFAYHGFLFPPKISDKRGLPVVRAALGIEIVSNSQSLEIFAFVNKTCDVRIKPC